MTQLLFIIGGWIGLLSRGPMLLQMLVGGALVLAYRGWKLAQRRELGCWRPVLAKLVLAALMAAASLLFASFGQPGGLLLLMAQLVAIWTGLSALRLLLRRWVDPDEVQNYWQRAVLPLYVVLSLVGLVHQLDGLDSVSQVPILKLFDQPFTFGNLLLLLALPYFLVVLSELPVALIGGVAGRLAGMDPGNRKAFELILRYFLIGLGVVWLADQIGLNGTAIAAIAGGLSVGLGFGIKEVFSNFVSGLWLLFEGSLRPGDVVMHQGDLCRVNKLGLRAATLKRKSDNAELVVPNQTFFIATTTTYTGTEDLRCATLQVHADYKHDADRVIALLLEIVQTDERVLADPAPSAGVTNLGPYAVEYGLDYWMVDPTKSGSIASALRRMILRRFREEGIEIPTMPAPLPAS